MDEMLKVFKKELEAEGLEIAEETAKDLLAAVLRVLPKAVQASPNQYDDLLVPVLMAVQPYLLQLIEDINPADNEPEAEAQG